MSFPLTFRLHIYGDHGVGKTTFLESIGRLVTFDEISYYQINNNSLNDKEIQLEIYENYSVPPHAAIIMHDLSNPQTFSSVPNYISVTASAREHSLPKCFFHHVFL